MLFNSPIFLFLLLPLTILAFGAARFYRPEAQSVVLLAASAVFYAWWSPPYLALLTASIGV